MMRHRVVSALVMAALASVSTTELQAQESMRDQVSRFAAPYIKDGLVQGMTVGVIKRGESGAFGFGRATAERGSTPDGKTAYEIGSISKVFTSLLLADAVTRKLVSLEEPVQQLLPKGVTMPQKGDKPITLLNLATHTSGLPRIPDNLDPAAEDPYAGYTTKELYEFLNKHQLSRAPGEACEYSNLAAGLLGTLVASRSESSYEALLKNRICDPLGMNDTAVTLSGSQRQHLAAPFLAAEHPAVNWHFDCMVGAGGILSTVDDMLKFMKANLHPPKGELGDALELAWRIHQAPINKDVDFAICLGWHVARDGQTRWHNGQTAGYHSMLLINRPLQLAVVVLANTASGEVDEFAQTLFQSLAGADVEPRKVVDPVKVAREVMERYVGKYQLAPQVVFTVSVKDDKLMVGLTGQPTFQVFPQSETEWKYKVVDATLTFKVDDNGKCDELSLFQFGMHQTAKRVE